MSDCPNILFIMSDEHDPGVTGCYGDPLVATPNLDRLAAEGVRFDGCYTNSPLCVPARLSFTAGKYVSRCGAWNNTCRLPSDEVPSIARVLRAADPARQELIADLHRALVREVGEEPDDTERRIRRERARPYAD